MAVSPAENLSYLLGTAEPHLQKIIRQYVADGDTVYDIGANLGYVTLSLAKQVGTRGHVFAFEPVPQNIDALRENIRRNQLSTVMMFGVAASDRQGQAVIRVAENLSTASLIWHKGDASVRELTIDTVAIDELVESGNVIGNPRFVKIDVEGAEGLALLGMQRTIAAARPVIFVECSEAG
jgi:FkbM family methyltransferase